jgi:membrane protease YdiL (CAAX protease family)
MLSRERVFANSAPRAINLYQPYTNWPPWAAIAIVLAILAIWMVAFPFAVSAALPHVVRPFDPWLSIIEGIGIGLSGWVISGRTKSERARAISWRGRLNSGDITNLSFAISAMLIISFIIRHVGDPFVGSRSTAPTGWELTGTLIFAVAIAPLVEELIFRGFLLSSLSQTRFGFWPAAVFTSLCWTSLHWVQGPQGLLNIFVMGLVLSVLLYRTGNLITCVIAHTVYNTYTSALIALTYFLFRT